MNDKVRLLIALQRRNAAGKDTKKYTELLERMVTRKTLLFREIDRRKSR